MDSHKQRAARVRLGAMIAVVAASACSDSAPPAPDEPTLAVTSAIEGGRPVNHRGDPYSFQFPRSTVMIRTPNSSTGLLDTCTGVIIAPAKILTAAHCLYPLGKSTNPLGEERISFYPAKLPIGTAVGSTPDFTRTLHPPIVTPKGMAACGQDNACYRSLGYYADLAIITLDAPVDAPYRPAVLAPREQAIAKSTVWTVGTGVMNELTSDRDENTAGEMDWLPMYGLVGNGMVAGTIETLRQLADSGDSGGPIYAYDKKNDQLLLYGILSFAVHQPDPDHPDAGVGLNWNVYTRVVQGDNYDWIVGQLTADAGSPPSPTASFGAAQ